MRPEHPTAPLSQIIVAASEVFGIPHEEIVGKRRLRPIVRARQAVARVAYEEGWSGNQIARRLNRKDHTTILYARDQVDIHAPRDPEFADRVNQLRARAESLRGAPMLKGYSI